MVQSLQDQWEQSKDGGSSNSNSNSNGRQKL